MNDMGKLVRDFVEVPEYTSIDALIEALTAIRDTLPTGSDAEVRLRGDDIFGRAMAIAFMRPLTSEEAACEARYDGSSAISLAA